MIFAALALAAAALPAEPLVLETTTTAFTPAWELALDGGTVWRRPTTVGAARAWEPLPATGLPPGPSQLSADGENLVVVDAGSRVHYAKLGALSFAASWGPPGLTGALTLPDDTLAWAVSHRAQPYEDIDGNVHPPSAGVTTLYALTSDGRIAYQDPWLPPPAAGARWPREICPPERGALTLVALAASASTIAVMDDGGRVHTRLADFDTMGNNPALPYSWRRERRTGLAENVRSLPPEDWRLQPALPGPHAAALTVFFTGEGNARRRLRVEGTGGFFEKDVLEPAWRWVRHPASSPVLLAPRPSSRRPARGEPLTGKLARASVEVAGFDLQCPGARMTVRRDGEEVTLALWHAERLLELNRRELDLRGALVVDGAPTGKLADDLRTLLGGDVHEVEVDVRDRYVEVKSAGRLGLAPRLKVRLSRSSRPMRP